MDLSLPQPDRLFARPMDPVPDFVFDASVAAVFPDMISRSVPGYGAILHLLPLITRRFARPGTVCYDLGCSLGASTLALRQGLGEMEARIVAVDNAEAMVAGCRAAVAATPGAPVDVLLADIEAITVENASVVVLHFTLQFIPLARRLPLLQHIRAGMHPGGALLLSEKLTFEDPLHAEILTSLHHDFKRANGYSDLEISQKRAAIEHVLLPETLATHQQRLALAGFQTSVLWFQQLNFASILALA